MQPRGCWEARVASGGLRLAATGASPPAPAPKAPRRASAISVSGLAWTSGTSEHVYGRPRRRIETCMRPLVGFCTRPGLCIRLAQSTSRGGRGDDQGRQGVSVNPRQQLLTDGTTPRSAADRQTCIDF